MTRCPNVFQFENEASELRRVWDSHFAKDSISDVILRSLLRKSRPSAVQSAIALTREQFQQVNGAMAFAQIRKALVRNWKQVCERTETVSHAVAGAQAPASREKEPMRLTKKQAAQLLHISEATLLRRTKAGRYQCTREGTGQYAKTFYTYQSIGLVEPLPAVIPLAVSHPAPLPESEPDAEPQEPSQIGPSRTYATGWNADRSMFVTSDGTVYRRHPRSGQMYRSDERKLHGRVEPTSPSAADSCIRHPWSIEPSKAPKEQLGALAIWEIDKRR